jgi:hypothetical protein
MPQQIDTSTGVSTESLGADEQDDRAKGTELKHERVGAVRGGAGAPASGRTHGWATSGRRWPGSGVCPDASLPALKPPPSMNTTAPQLTDVAPQFAGPTVQRLRSSVSPDHPTWDKVTDETVPLIGAFFGPPVIFLLGPWLLFVLLLIGPFALILTLVLATAAAASLLAMFVGLIASPYLLIRHLRAHRTVRTKPRPPLRLPAKHRVSSSQMGLEHAEGLS